MPDFGKLRRYLALPSRSAGRIQRDVDEELETHIDMRAESYVGEGMSRAQARARALREFGDLEDAREYCASVDRSGQRRRRVMGWLSEVGQDARLTLRLLRRSPAFAAATVLTLGAAVGASTAVYSVLHTYLIRPLPYANADRLVSFSMPPGLDRQRSPRLDEVNWRSVDSLFDATVTTDFDGFTVPGSQGAETVVGSWVNPGFFKALGVRPALGRMFAADEYRVDSPVGIISHAYWRRRFGGDSSVIGATITAYSTDHPTSPATVTIVGVTPPGFWPIFRFSDLLRPAPPGNDQPILATLKPGATLGQSETAFNTVLRGQLKGDVDPVWRMALVPTLTWHSARVKPILFAVFGAAVFMLLAACGSVAGALVSRMAARRREFAVRVALGGSRARIIRQLLTESGVLATLAGVVGVALTFALLKFAGPAVEQQLGTRVPGGVVGLQPTWEIVALSLGVSAIAGIMLGLVPALLVLRRGSIATAPSVLGAVRGSAGASTGARARRVLIAGQVAVAMVLLFGAGLMFRTIARMAATDLGFRSDGVVTATMLLPDATYPDSAAKRQVMDRLLSVLRAADGVRNAAAVDRLPFWGAGDFPVLAEGGSGDPETAPKTGVYTVSPGYFETMGLRVRAGRDFRSTDDHAATLVVVVSEKLARALSPDGAVLGRRIRVRVPYLANYNDDDKMPLRTIVGVVTDTKKEFSTNGGAEAADTYVPYAQNPRSREAIVVWTDRAETVMAPSVRQAVGSVDPNIALGLGSVDASIADATSQRRGLAALLGAFATFSLVLSALALYASLAYAVVQRRADLSVRMAIGANARSILQLVIGEGLATAAIGVVVGVAASLALGRVLANQLYGVGTGDPVTLVAISLVLTLAAGGACLVPALRASRTDPGLALRD
jgi:predicted permease